MKQRFLNHKYTLINNKKVFIFFLLLGLMLTSCNLSEPLQTYSTEGNQIIESTAIVITADSTAIEHEPSITPTVPLNKVQIGFYNNQFLTYDPSLWNPVLILETANQYGELTYRLQHIYINGCFLQDNLGHGMDPNLWQRVDSTKVLGELNFNIEKWVNTKTGNPWIIVYDWQYTKRIELIIIDNPDECIQAAEHVLALSSVDIQAE